jgi:3-phenylpropionate/trans-cinnamate dioxygenase ferredoxin reductase subunit
MTRTIAIVGASLAGGQAALSLRQNGFDGRVVLVGGESHPPYERPPLSKAVLLGEADPATTLLVPPSRYDEVDIELVLGVRAKAIRPTDRSVVLDDGRSIVVDRLLLTTGAQPRSISLPGRELIGVHELRTLDHAVALRDALQPGARVVVIGAGFIGAEVAAIARARGCSVALVEMAELPLQRVLGAEVGALYAAMHRAKGVDLHLNARPVAILGDTRCTAVELDNGAVLEADVVVCGVGVSPAIELAAEAGALIDNGITVDGLCRTTIPNVYAAGDVASRPTSFAPGRIRLESWQNAQNHGIAAAAAMLGSAEEFDDLPWFWSDQYEVNLQLAGLPSAQDTVVWRGDTDAFDCAAFYLRDGLITGVIGLNRPRDVRATMDLIRRRIPVDPASLADESTDLRSLRSPLVRG